MNELANWAGAVIGALALLYAFFNDRRQRAFGEEQHQLQERIFALETARERERQQEARRAEVRASRAVRLLFARAVYAVGEITA